MTPPSSTTRPSYELCAQWHAHRALLHDTVLCCSSLSGLLLIGKQACSGSSKHNRAALAWIVGKCRDRGQYACVALGTTEFNTIYLGSCANRPWQLGLPFRVAAGGCRDLDEPVAALRERHARSRLRLVRVRSSLGVWRRISSALTHTVHNVRERIVGTQTCCAHLHCAVCATAWP